MQQRLTGVTEDVFETELPFHHNGRIYDIRVVALTDNGERTGMYRPLISVDGESIGHSVERAESMDAAHYEAIRWIKDTYRDNV